MAYSGRNIDPAVMRIAAVALAWIVGTIAIPAAAEPNGPPYRSGPPPASPRPPLPTDIRAYAAAPPAPRIKADATRPPRGRTCFNQGEAREKIAQHRLTDPVSAMVAGRAQGEALRAHLCRWKQDQFVYEVYVLRRDGRVVRVYMNAQNGEAVSGLDAAEHR